MKFKVALIFLLGLILFVFTNCGVPLGVREELVWENNNVYGGNIVGSHDAFEQYVYPITRDHCISCHNVLEPIHASDDVTKAHDAVINQYKINFLNLSNSRMVAKLRDENHNCWSDCEENADEMLAGLKKWKAAIKVDAPILNPPEVNPPVVSPPVTPPFGEAVTYSAFKEHVYPITRARCITCHHTIEPVHASDDYEIAHDALIQQYKVNFTNLPSSRIVAKLRDESHNCWSNCQENAQEMLSGLEKWHAAILSSNPVDETPDDQELVGLTTSMSRTMKEEFGQQTDISLIFDLSGILKQSGISFVVDVAEYDSYSYKFSNPRILAPSGVKVKVKSIKLHLNGVFSPQYATFTYVDTVSSADNPLSPYTMVVLKNLNNLQDKVSFSFEILELAANP
jgi:hypothetical protein